MKTALHLLLAAGFALAVETARAQISINAFSAIQPNFPPVPLGIAWQTNGIVALQNGLTSYGDPNSPTYFSMASQPISITDAISTRGIGGTGFNSWRGSASPDTYGTAFTNLLGNRLNFGAIITASNGLTFSISQLSFQATSTDENNLLGFTQSSLSYRQSAVGWISNLDGTISYVTVGPNTTEVNGLFIVGFNPVSGSSLAIDTNSPGDTVQDKINNVGLDYGLTNEFFFTGTFTLTTPDGTFTGGSSFDIMPVPEPSMIAFVGLGLALNLLQLRKRTTKR